MNVINFNTNIQNLSINMFFRFLARDEIMKFRLVFGSNNVFLCF